MDLVPLIALGIQKVQCNDQGILLLTLGMTVDRCTLQLMIGAALLPLNTLARRARRPPGVVAYPRHVMEQNLYNLLQIPIIILDLCNLLLVVTTHRFRLKRMGEHIRSGVDRYKATQSQCSGG
jgi:hypothetical protein